MNDVRTLKGGILTNEQLKITVPLALQQAGLCFATGDFSATVAVSLRILKSMEDAQTALESYDMPFNAYSWIASLTAGFSALLGDFDNAVMCGRKSLDIAREAKNLLSVALAELWYGFVLAVRGLGEDATGYLMKSIEHFEQAGTGDDLAFSAGSWFMLGYAKFLLGDLEAARQHMEKAVKMTLDRKIAYYLAFTYATLSTVHLAAGDVTNAQDCVESASEWAQKLCQKHFEGLAKICSGKILAESGLLQAAKAEASILEGIEIVTEFSMRPWRAQGHLYLGELYAGTGRTQLGIKNLKKAERMFEDMGMDYWVSKTRDVLDRFQQS